MHTEIFFFTILSPGLNSSRYQNYTPSSPLGSISPGLYLQMSSLVTTTTVTTLCKGDAVVTHLDAVP